MSLSKPAIAILSQGQQATPLYNFAFLWVGKRSFADGVSTNKLYLYYDCLFCFPFVSFVSFSDYLQNDWFVRGVATVLHHGKVLYARVTFVCSAEDLPYVVGNFRQQSLIGFAHSICRSLAGCGENWGSRTDRL